MRDGMPLARAMAIHSEDMSPQLPVLDDRQYVALPSLGASETLGVFRPVIGVGNDPVIDSPRGLYRIGLAAHNLVGRLPDLCVDRDVFVRREVMPHGSALLRGERLRLCRIGPGAD